ncbi:MAG TPA: LPXTG cell wall anchor domain-containing protein [Pyrinomonadaceae bacterium]
MQMNWFTVVAIVVVIAGVIFLVMRRRGRAS